MYVYQIIHQVQEAHRGLCTRLAERSRKAKQLWQSHAAEPVTMNPESYGKPSPADHFVEFCEDYEAGAEGAGLMLSEMVAAEIRSRLTVPTRQTDQRTMRRDVLKEATEALTALDDCDFEDATLAKLKAITNEVQEMVNTGSRVVGHLLAIVRQKEVERRHNGKTVSFETRKKVQGLRRAV